MFTLTPLLVEKIDNHETVVIHHGSNARFEVQRLSSFYVFTVFRCEGLQLRFEKEAELKVATLPQGVAATRAVMSHYSGEEPA